MSKFELECHEDTRLVLNINGLVIDIYADADGVGVDILKDGGLMTSTGWDFNDNQHENA